MSRSYAIMMPGGFYVGSTTGWLVNQTEPEYLRCVRAAATAPAFILGRTGSDVSRRYRINVTQTAYYYLTVR